MWFGAFLFALAFAVPTSAQVTIQIGGPPVPGFSNYYPWFNDVPQYRGDQSFRWFLANHPNVAQQLARNPGLLYNPNWRRRHSQLEQYFATHPQVWAMLNGEYWATGPAETQWGDYDDQHQWRDAYWWHEYNPDRFYDTHPDWVSLDPRWRDHDGDYDQAHVWHYKGLVGAEGSDLGEESSPRLAQRTAESDQPGEPGAEPATEPAAGTGTSDDPRAAAAHC